MSPAFLGVGYIIGPKLAGINFSGGVLAWGLLAPGPRLLPALPRPGAGRRTGPSRSPASGRDYVRCIAIGGMLVGAFYTLFKMRKSLIDGHRPLARQPARGAAAAEAAAAPHRPRHRHPVGRCWPSALIAGRRLLRLQLLRRQTSLAAVVAAVRDGRPGLRLRRRLGLPGRHHRRLEQPDQRPDGRRC